MTTPNLSLEPKKYTVSIEYCVPCDYSAHVFQATEEILGHYQHVIDRLVIVTGSDGVFDLKVDDETLFSKQAHGRHAEPGELLKLFEQRVGPEVSRYPR